MLAPNSNRETKDGIGMPEYGPTYDLTSLHFFRLLELTVEPVSLRVYVIPRIHYGT